MNTRRADRPESGGVRDILHRNIPRRDVLATTNQRNTPHMTIFAAALCNHVEMKPAVITVSDRMITSGDIEYEDIRPKMLELAPRAVCLYAGNREFHYMIARAAIREIVANGLAEISDIADAYSSAFVDFRRKRAENRVLAPFGLNMDTFRSQQEHMNAAVVADMKNRISDETVGVQAIIAGTDSTGAHIYSIARADREFMELPLPVCHDTQEFVAIGTGYRQFETHFMTIGYTKTWETVWGLMVMLEAKKKAEMSPGVGPTTDAHVICEDVKIWTPEWMEKLQGFNKAIQDGLIELRKKYMTEAAIANDPSWKPPT